MNAMTMTMSRRVNQAILTVAAVALVWAGGSIRARATDYSVKTTHPMTASAGSLGIHRDGLEALAQGNLKVTPIPEATTMIAAAALLVPFAASTIRLRKSRAA
jgi:hypothetical protein